MGGFVEIVVLVIVIVVIWFGVTTISAWWNNSEQKNLFEKVWESSPELKRSYDNLGAEIDRLTQARNKLQKMQGIVESQSAKIRAENEIRKLDVQIARVKRLRDRVVGAIEEIALVTETSSVTTELDQQAIRDLEKEVGNVMASSSVIIGETGKDLPEQKEYTQPETPRVEAPRVEAPRVEAPRVETPRPKTTESGIPTPTRTWTRFTGEKIQAKVIAFNSSKATLTFEKPDGKVFKNFSLWRLSRPDQRYILRVSGVSDFHDNMTNYDEAKREKSSLPPSNPSASRASRPALRPGNPSSPRYNPNKKFSEESNYNYDLRPDYIRHRHRSKGLP